MDNSPPANSLSVSVRVYRALLAAYPKKFREHYETQMVQVFRDSFREAHQSNGMSGVIDLWLYTCADLLITAFIERVMERRQDMFSPKVILWGGVASLFGGLFWMLSGVAYSGGGNLFVLAFVLSLGGLAGLYSRQAGQGGRTGLAGFALGVAGTGLALATLFWGFATGRFTQINREPASAVPGVLIFCLALVIIGIGLVLLGVTTLRVTTLHTWRGMPLGLGLLSILYSMIMWYVAYLPLSQGRSPWDPMYIHRFDTLYPIADLLLGLGWMGLGLMLTTQADTRVAQPPPASA